MEEWEKTTVTPIDRFQAFINFLHKEGIFDKAMDHLKSQGLDQLTISVAHVHSIQEMLKEHFVSAMTPQVRAVIMSGHTNNHCS